MQGSPARRPEVWSPHAEKSRRALPQPRSQLTPEDWIRAARNLLVSRSVDAVRVEVLAKEMSVTRGSFYWHFKDRDDLLHRMLMAGATRPPSRSSTGSSGAACRRAS